MVASSRIALILFVNTMLVLGTDDRRVHIGPGKGNKSASMPISRALNEPGSQAAVETWPSKEAQKNTLIVNCTTNGVLQGLQGNNIRAIVDAAALKSLCE